MYNLIKPDDNKEIIYTEAMIVISVKNVLFDLSVCVCLFSERITVTSRIVDFDEMFSLAHNRHNMFTNTVEPC